jgi:hypothetical protein
MRAIRAACVAGLLLSVSGCAGGYVGAGYGYDPYTGYYGSPYYGSPYYGAYGNYPYPYSGYYGPYRGNYRGYYGSYGAYGRGPYRYGGYAQGRPTYRGTTVRPYYGGPSRPYYGGQFQGGRYYRR